MINNLLVMIPFHEKLRAAVDHRNCSQKQVAEAVGVAPSRVSEWLSGSGMPQHDKLIPLARYLGTSLDYLLDPDAEDPEYRAVPTSDMEAKLAWLVEIVGGPEEAIRRIVDAPAATAQKNAPNPGNRIPQAQSVVRSRPVEKPAPSADKPDA